MELPLRYATKRHLGSSRAQKGLGFRVTSGMGLSNNGESNGKQTRKTGCNKAQGQTNMEPQTRSWNDCSLWKGHMSCSRSIQYSVRVIPSADTVFRSSRSIPRRFVLRLPTLSKSQPMQTYKL